MKKKKKNIFIRFFQAIGRGIKNFFLYLFYLALYIAVMPLTRSKIRGKENVNPKDEARVFIANHYEIYGPVIMFTKFPYKFRPWVIDKIMDPKTVEEQMALGVYNSNNFQKFPKWIKVLAVKAVRSLMIFTMHHAKAISVSRENIRANFKTMEESVETLKKGKAILIFPELAYVKEGVGEFQTGFEHLGKFYYQKTGKKISFYPVFVSQFNKEVYIEKPIVYNPENNSMEEKQKIVTYLHDSMVNLYKTKEIPRREEFEKKQSEKLARKNKKLKNKNKKDKIKESE